MAAAAASLVGPASPASATPFSTEAQVHGIDTWSEVAMASKEGPYLAACPSCGVQVVVPMVPLHEVRCFECRAEWAPPHAAQPSRGDLRLPIPRRRRLSRGATPGSVDSCNSFKQMANFVLRANVATAKVKIGNKIGKKPTGIYRDFALTLQRGLYEIRHGIDTIVRWTDDGVRRSVQSHEPDLFAKVRAYFGLSEREYNASLEMSKPLASETQMTVIGSEAASGKSPAFFLLSPDQRFILKTCTLADLKCFLRIAPGYADHVEKHRDTWISKFVGLYTVRIGGQHATFLVMNNFFAGQYNIMEKYDLKGSTYRRRASKKERKKKSPVFKDLDWIASGHKWEFRGGKAKAMATLREDVAFLARNKLIDYSLLVGVHYRPDRADPDRHEPPPLPERSLVLRQVTDKTLIYYGIVDILTPWSAKKKLEKFVNHSLLRRHSGMRSASCTDPDSYAKRFFEFVERYSVDHEEAGADA